MFLLTNMYTHKKTDSHGWTTFVQNKKSHIVLEQIETLKGKFVHIETPPIQNRSHTFQESSKHKKQRKHKQS